ncbi:hypothetical protein [Acinetobacter baumannii]|uniref:hypothetical protein n=4 Tax=Acinetobacter baumannii TaxID=470 RepID=UPI0005142C4F|nr:hypothetical protein [Acinetobacter baumannii]EHU2144401.1 hypothetical protein [Acinetobacter baumannii]EHU2655321.1 hypothetical protein [Acinetobacter baumannii]EHU2723671.1 hypothetical protein [Acinetobacter baumannii]EHU2842375.1 hypothetical protein [Acinetobacter baumannii]EHU3381248.1 hypothetical protein [Acinetobacter baumannii]
MDEDEINIIAYNYVGYIKLKKDIIFPADSNKNDIIYNQSGVNRRVFSGYVSFPEVEKNTLFYMKAFLLTLNVDIPCKEEIHSLIKIFSYCENHSSLIEKLSLGLKSNSKGLVFNGLKEVISDFYLLEKIDDLFFYDGR